LSRLLFMMGPGGVGKTTLSVLYGYYYARCKNQKTLVLSIDPSKRLAAELNLELNGNIKSIEAGFDAAVLDQKAIFDQMMERFIPQIVNREKLKKHPLYEAASNHFGGAVEYMALMKIEQHLTEYDLIIVDTPPDLHAIDFLNRPEVLSQFFEHKIFSWLIKPAYFAAKIGLVSVASKAFSALARIVGTRQITNIIDFLYHMMPFIEGFHTSAEKMRVHFHASSSRYILIHRPDNTSYKSVLELSKALKNLGLKASCLIQNQAAQDPLPERLHPKDFLYKREEVKVQQSIEKDWHEHQNPTEKIKFHRIYQWPNLPLGKIDHAKIAIDVF
jgi:anion-transporting  ArsA/GET3 family ATPase